MLTIEPLTDDIMKEFVPIKLQCSDLQKTLSGVYNKFLPHNFCFFDEDGPVLMAGMTEVDEGVYDTYTIFSDNWKPKYYKYIVRSFKGYIEHMDYDMIFHVISNKRPWTHKMIKMFGFTKYSGDEEHTIYSIGGL